MSALDTASTGYLSYLINSIREQHSPNESAAFISYNGPIDYNYIEYYKREVEELSVASKLHGLNTLNVILNTGGGSVEAVEKMVEINRYHYESVNFYVPDMAMSAGTIFCMSGDAIFMDYASSLGPIDPQVRNDDGKWVPALGYLEMYESLINKSMDNVITAVEFSRFQSIDLAEISRYEQAKQLSIDLLKKWLVEYKFKDWLVGETSGRTISHEDRVGRAEEIATKLMDTSVWRSHGRMIGIKTVREYLNLKVNDYSNNNALRTLLNQYIELIGEYASQRNMPVFIHSNVGYLENPNDATV